ncbi:MAG: DUF6788 family protein [Candidatus Paceibacterota bacterium]|jgi:hypothetical protein
MFDSWKSMGEIVLLYSTIVSKVAFLPQFYLSACMNHLYDSYMKTKILQVEKKINDVKKKLMSIEDMRPGSLTQQYRQSRKSESYGTYWSLSYTSNKKGHTEYIRNEFVNEVKIQINNYKKFKILTDKWIELSIQLAQEKLKNSRQELEE